MRIGLVRRGFSATGGAEAYLVRLTEALRAAGHRVTLFASVMTGWDDEDQDLFDNVLLAPAAGPVQFSNALAAINPRRHCDVLFSLERVASCDVYRAGDGVHAAWLRRRSVVEPLWRPLVRQYNPKHRQLLALEEALMHQPNLQAVIANSRFVRQEIEEFHGVDPGKIPVIYNGLPADRFGFDPEIRDRKRRELKLTPDTVAVLFTGSGWDRKGLAWAIEAIEKLPRQSNFRLLIAGKGRIKKGWNTGDRAVFLGPRRDVPELLQAADLFLLPTLYDPFSNATLEALAAGLPVITTPANGVSEIFQPGEHGEVLKHGSDVPGIVAALKAWRDPDRRATRREAIIEVARPFTIERNVTQTLAVLEKSSL